ncbi:DUF4115 domain-containing protein [Chrysosporum bergii ANA360D]|jgi:cytoskeletal protein RodZ|uniref:DUF4115 domain-containing protein n=1 Tax=Chrysosporum bergii ANA360D TaxID=617107 RepID=A0AA43GRM4_9CYAN|nr:RodZ domain-containing protein [Chrysosporum bergii]MDH6060367.1 DUF4115 domain-containing protein [Chrysosporum bergii ANA360D]
MKWLKSKDQYQPKVSLKQQQSEKLAELGGRLWASRQERGLSMEEMVVLTKIPQRLLQAIEQGKLDELPEPVYIQGLIRQFADALSLNGVEFSRNFPIGSPTVSLTTTLKHQSIIALRPLHLYFLYIFVIVCSVSSLSQLLNNATVSESGQNLRKKTVLKPQLDQLNHHNHINDSQSVNVGVTLKASSWIRVVADGKIEFEGILPEGTQRTWKAKKELTVKTDNAGSLLMTINQQPAQALGEPGKEKEIKIGAKPRF